MISLQEGTVLLVMFTSVMRKSLIFVSPSPYNQQKAGVCLVSTLHIGISQRLCHFPEDIYCRIGNLLDKPNQFWVWISELMPYFQRKPSPKSCTNTSLWKCLVVNVLGKFSSEVGGIFLLLSHCMASSREPHNYFSDV